MGQWLNGDGFADYEHAFIVMPDGYLIEAQPGGAQLVKNSYPDETTIYSHHTLDQDIRDRIVSEAMKTMGTPYSFLDYLALALHRFHIRTPGLKRYIESSGHMICSQLVDRVYATAGVHLFADDRWPGDCTPADLLTVVEGSG
jgi:uncharacterized protein YycO